MKDIYNQKPVLSSLKIIIVLFLFAGSVFSPLFLDLRGSHAQILNPDDWGTPIDPGVGTNFLIYTQNFTYADPFLITDMRSSDNHPIESYNMHTLDIYRPADGGALLENRPVVFFVHGGGWTDGYKDRFRSVSWSFTGQLGWVTVVIDYRLTSYDVFLADQYCPDRETCGLPQNAGLRSKAAEYPDNIQDVALAFTWTRNQIAEQGGNPNRIYGLGYSAGAHLITLMVMHPEFVDLRPGLRAVAALSGPYNLVDPVFKNAYHNVLAPTFGEPLEDPELADASPQVHVSDASWLPPFMLLYAEHDLPYFDSQTLNLAQAIQNIGMPVETVFLEGSSHESEMGDLRFIEKYPTQRIVEFFKSLFTYKHFLPFIPQK